MKPVHTIVFLIAAGLLAGCAPSQQEFAAVREAIRGSEKTRQFALNSCMTSGWQQKDVQVAAMILDTSEKAAPRLACRRYLEAFKSGRLKYADAVAFKQGRMTPEVIKILQGR